MDEKKLAIRLREEIGNVAGGRTKVAAFLGVARNTVYNWMEKGNIPADKLEDLEELGVDIGYVLTGLRTSEFEARLNRLHDVTVRVQEVAPEYGVDPMELKELRDIAYSHQLSDQELRQILNIIKRTSSPSGSHILHGDMDLELIEAALTLSFEYLDVADAHDLPNEDKVNFLMHILDEVIEIDRNAPPDDDEKIILTDEQAQDNIVYLDQLRGKQSTGG